MLQMSLFRDIRAIAIVAVSFATIGLFGGESAASSSWEDLPDTATVLTINGISLSKLDFEHHFKMMEVFYENTHDEKNGEKKNAFMRKVRSNALGEMIARTVISTHSNTVSITISDSDIDDALERIYKRFKASNQKFEDFIAQLEAKGILDAVKREQVSELKLKKYLADSFSAQMEVSEEDIDGVIDFITNSNAIATSTNSATNALATSIVARIRNGENFTQMRDQYHYYGDGGYIESDLGECTESDFADETSKVWDIVCKLHPGEVTDVLDVSDGFAVFCNVGESDYSPTNGINLSRILFRKAYLFPMQERDEIREELERERQSEIPKKVLKDLIASSQIEYPSGKEIFKSINTK